MWNCILRISTQPLWTWSDRCVSWNWSWLRPSWRWWSHSVRHRTSPTSSTQPSLSCKPPRTRGSRKRSHLSEKPPQRKMPKNNWLFNQLFPAPHCIFFSNSHQTLMAFYRCWMSYQPITVSNNCTDWLLQVTCCQAIVMICF